MTAPTAPNAPTAPSASSAPAAASAAPASPAIDLPMLLQRAVDEAAALLQVDVAVIYLVAEGEPEARWAFDSGIDDDDVRSLVRAKAFPIGVGMVGQALATGETIITEDYTQDDRFWDRRHREETHAALGLESAVAAPMVGSHGVSLGVLCLFDRATREFASRDVAFINALAGHAALAIENGRLIERLSDAEARHRFLLDRLPDGIWAADDHGIFTYLSASSERLTGYRPDELLGKSSQILMHESTQEAWAEGYRWQVAHPDGEQTYRVNLRHKDGRAVPVELHNIGTPVNGKYGGGQGSVREMTDRDRLEREIRAQAAELAANSERAHLAQELHDSVTQALFSMTITAGAARMLLERNAPGVGAKLDELSGLARDALAEMRSLIFELRPGSLAEEGFLPALQKHVAAVQGRTGLAIRLDVDPNLARLPLSVEDALYRIAQEAVHNIVKHAGAREVRIQIASPSTDVRMGIRDDGNGFDPQSQSGGLGLAGMAARAERLGGCVTVESAPGHGTVVLVTLPATAGPDSDPEAGR